MNYWGKYQSGRTRVVLAGRPALSHSDRSGRRTWREVNGLALALGGEHLLDTEGIQSDLWVGGI